jgi:hypothetical protein
MNIHKLHTMLSLGCSAGHVCVVCSHCSVALPAMSLVATMRAVVLYM